MVLPIVLVGVAGAAWAARVGVVRYNEYLARRAAIPAIDRVRQAYRGPFADTMTVREAALILNIKGDGASPVDPKALARAHRKLMLLNHPDNGGSPLLATKVNEAKELLAQQGKGRGPRR